MHRNAVWISSLKRKIIQGGLAHCFLCQHRNLRQSETGFLPHQGHNAVTKRMHTLLVFGPLTTTKPFGDWNLVPAVPLELGIASIRILSDASFNFIKQQPRQWRYLAPHDFKFKKRLRQFIVLRIGRCLASEQGRRLASARPPSNTWFGPEPWRKSCGLRSRLESHNLPM